MKQICPPIEPILQKAFVYIQQKKMFDGLTVQDIRLPLTVMEEGRNYALRHFDTVAHFNKCQ